jgi:MFS family permease
MALRPVKPALFTARFFVMCSFTFTVFLSAFMLFPTAPFRIVSLGGSKFAAGLFLGFLTYASALSAPFTGALADRVGKRRMLMVCGFALALLLAAYAVTRSYTVPLALAFAHGVFWSGLLSASAAYLTDIIPESRRAEGIGYWGLSTNLALAVAPSTGLWLFRHDWLWVCGAAFVLNLAMTGIASTLPDTGPPSVAQAAWTSGGLVEWHVLKMALTLFLYSFGYGAITSFSALYADAIGVAPKGIYFTALALVVILVRPFSGPLADRVGHRRVLMPSLLLIAAGLALLALATSRLSFVLSAVVFAAGFGTAYPVFVAHVMTGVDPRRRGAAFGSILAAFDTGIGTGSILTGFLVERLGFHAAFGVAAVLAALSLPYFLAAEKRLLIGAEGAQA